MDAALAELEGFDWVVFTSVNAVRSVAARWKSLGRSQKQLAGVAHVAAVGPATAEAAKKAGFLVDHIATTHNGVALAHELGELVCNKRVFLPRSDRASPDLPAALKGYGARMTEVIASRSVRPSDTDREKLNEILSGGADAILCFSPTAVNYFEEILGHGQLRIAQDKIALIAIGPVTASALRDAKVESMLVATDTTLDAAVDALEDYFAKRGKQLQAGVKQG